MEGVLEVKGGKRGEDIEVKVDLSKARRTVKIVSGFSDHIDVTS